MLTVTVVLEEGFDDDKEEFVAASSYDLHLEHSLVSLSKWEAFHEKPFLGNTQKSPEETLWYISAMSEEEIPPAVFEKLSQENVEAIQKYISAKMTASWIKEDPNAKNSREVITSELIYYWMFSFGIPIECETWHLNRLMMLIKIFSHKNQPEKKRSAKEMAAERTKLNEQRRAQLNSTG